MIDKLVAAPTAEESNQAKSFYGGIKSDVASAIMPYMARAGTGAAIAGIPGALVGAVGPNVVGYVARKTVEMASWIGDSFSSADHPAGTQPCTGNCPESMGWKNCDEITAQRARRQAAIETARHKAKSPSLSTEERSNLLENAAALERNQEACKKAKLSNDVYGFYDYHQSEKKEGIKARCGCVPPTPCGYKRLDESPDIMKSLGFWDGKKETLEQAKNSLLTNNALTGEKSSFAAMIYVEDAPSSKVVTAFRGTESNFQKKEVDDIETDFQQAIGNKTESYEKAKGLAKLLKRNVTPPQDIEFTGHSLGGGEAQAAAIVTNKRADIFNGAGVHENTIGGDEMRAHGETLVHRFNSVDDPLTKMSENRVLQKDLVEQAAKHKEIASFFGPNWMKRTVLAQAAENAKERADSHDGFMLPQAVGKDRHVIEAIDDKGNKVAPTDLGGQHSMANMVSGIEVEKVKNEHALQRIGGGGLPRLN